MERWTSTPWYGFVLVGVLLLIALIQVLPQVDLPATVLNHDATAALRTPRTMELTQFTPAISLSLSLETIALERGTPAPVVAHPDANFLPILHRSIRC